MGVKPYYQDKWTTIYHGDCLEIMPELEPVDLIATSPPYNCRKDYGSFLDEMPWGRYYFWMNRFLDECYRSLCRGAVLAINVPSVIRYQHDHKYRKTWNDFDSEYHTHRKGKKIKGRGRIEPLGFKLFEMMFAKDPHMREPIIWVKGEENNAICTNYQMGSDNNPYMRPAHELILLSSKEQWFHRGGTGRRGRDAVPFIDYTKDVWHIQAESNKDHPAVWPIEIPLRLIKLFVHAKDAIILDPFMGRGTTLIVARHLGSRAMGIEIEEKYCEVAVQRLAQKVLEPEKTAS